MQSKPEPSLFEIFEEVAVLVGGSVVALMPFVVLSVPVIFPIAVLGGVIAAVVGLLAVVAGVVIGLPLLVGRQLMRLRRGRARPPAVRGAARG